MSSTVCRFRLSAVKELFATVGKELTFDAMYDDTIPEDMRFCKATPWGQVMMRIDNPSALAMFHDDAGKPRLGRYFHIRIEDDAQQS